MRCIQKLSCREPSFNDDDADGRRRQLRETVAEPRSRGSRGPSELGPHVGQRRVRRGVSVRRSEAYFRWWNLRLRLEVGLGTPTHCLLYQGM